MPSYFRNDIILVRYPFSDLSRSKVRPAVTALPAAMRYSLSPESYSASRLRIKKCASCVTAGSAALAVIRDDRAIGVANTPSDRNFWFPRADC